MAIFVLIVLNRQLLVVQYADDSISFWAEWIFRVGIPQMD